MDIVTQKEDRMYQKLVDFIETKEKTQSSLISVLHKTQNLFGYIPEKAVFLISEKLHLTPATIYGVVTFYSYFTLQPKGRFNFSVCLGTACYVQGASEVLEALEDELEIKNGETTEDGIFSIQPTRCLGDCANAPVVMVNDKSYAKVTKEGIRDIVRYYREYAKNNPQVEEVEEEEVQEEVIFEKQALSFEGLKELHKEEKEKLDQKLQADPNIICENGNYRLKGAFYENQCRVALRNSGIINPESIQEAIARGAYLALASILEKKTSPQEVVDEMKASKLRGRGGAGFPTGRKWETALNYNESDYKIIICNADEGDPGAYMDRSILETDPHAVLEGMAIGAYAINGGTKGYIYVRAEYPLAVRRLQIAIQQAEALGLLGDNILGTDFSFTIEIRLGAGAFVCGEGTALMESIEGKRGMPRVKHFRTAHRGLFDKPTIINNVETLANVPGIIRNGAEAFAKIGTEESGGTKVFALVGKVKNPGLVEVPMGTTLRQLVYDIGGGLEEGRTLKAIQTGGPSGGCIPADLLDTPVDFSSLAKIGSIMGSGGIVIMDDSDCMIDVSRFFIDFSVDESCGKCTPCRIGNKRILEMLDRFAKGQGKEEDITYLEELCHLIKNTSLCGLGQASPNPVLSTLKFFRDEYQAHIEGTCPASVCKDLLKYTISYKCIGCGLCKRNCPVQCISGEVKEKHYIDQEVCISCGSCYTNCPVHAIERR